jgi:hypothetical protein
MENLFFTIFGAVLGWIPPAAIWFRDRFTTTGADHITFVFRDHNRPTEARLQCKIHIDIKNQLPGPVRIAQAYFVFDKGGPMRPDQLWSGEHGSGNFPVSFFCPATNTHTWPDIYLRPGEKTDVWFAVDPKLEDQHIRDAAAAKKIGTLYFQLTQWTQSGRPKTRWVRVKQ